MADPVLQMSITPGSGELRAIYVPDDTDEAMRDLVRAREEAVVVGRQAKYRAHRGIHASNRGYGDVTHVGFELRCIDVDPKSFHKRSSSI